MKQLFLIALLSFLFQNSIGAQNQLTPLEVDQNPNHDLALQSISEDSKQEILLQGTILQETYTAIDPLEDRRRRRAERKEYRSKRRLWRHQEAMERSKNTVYTYHDNFGFAPGFYPNTFYNNRISAPVAIGLGLLDVALWSSCFW